MTINTQRLILRELKQDDWEEMWKLSCDPLVTKYLDYIKFTSQDKAKEWINEKINANNESPRFAYNFAITLKDTNEFVGWIGIGKASDTKKGDLDFGYAIKPSFWKNGYAAESLTALIDYCFRELKVNKIFGECAVDNIASIKTMEKAGMNLEDYYYEKDETGKDTKHAKYFISNYIEETWTYWDFVQPFIRGDKRMMTKKRGLFLFLQILTSFVCWLLLFSTNLPSNINANSRAYTPLDILIFAVWFVVAYFYWRLYYLVKLKK